MKTNLILIVLVVFSFSSAFSQNVAINNDGSDPNSDAILHLKSTNKGLLIPTMTTSQRSNMTASSNGLLVYDTSTNSFWFRDNGEWHEILTDSYVPDNPDEIEDNDGNTKIQVEETNDEDIIRFDIDGDEQLIMKENAHGILLIEPATSSFNTAFGRNAGEDTDPSVFPDGAWNTYYGASAGMENQTGSYNTYIGYNSGRNNQTGDQNTFIGGSAGENNSSGNYNTILGYFSGQAQTAGSNNVYLGYAAGSTKSSGSNNVLLGYRAGRLNGSGSGNIMIGHNAGSNETNSNKLYIDNDGTSSPLIYGDFNSNLLRSNGTFYVNAISTSNNGGQLFFELQEANKFSIGYYSTNDYLCIKDEANNDRMMYFKDGLVGIQHVPSTNDLEVGGTASKSTAGDWLANSDARLKKNIKSLDENKVLEQLLQLQGITYEWDDQRPDYKRPEGVQYGFTAQNIQKVFPEFVTEDNEGYLQTAYGTYDAMYVEAIRALVQRVEALENQVNDLQSQVGK